MKNKYCKWILAIVWLIFMNAKVQAQEIDTTYAARMNYIFKYLDKNKVPFSLLKDAALELAELGNYNGVILADSNIVFDQNFRDVYLTLATSQIGFLSSGVLPGPNLVDSIWYSKRKPGRVTLAALYFAYSRFSDDALNKVTVINDQIYDQYVNGIWQNPYTTEKTLAITPATIEQKGLDFTLFLPSELWLSNQKQEVNKIEVDMSDGLGYRTLSPNLGLPVLYADTGVKILKFKVSLNNNTILQSRSVLHVTEKPFESTPLNPDFSVGPINDFGGLDNILAGPNQENFSQSIVPQGWILTQEQDKRDYFLVYSTESIDNKYALGQVIIQYASADKKIRKPLIVVEGFDKENYKHPEHGFGDIDIEDFLKNNKKSDDLEQLLIDFPKYDIIYINWKDGTADMHLNALLVKTVIKSINEIKVANAQNIIEKNVVLGQSMGGVIARYSLKKMELAGENHDVCLYVSHDAPHQGAYVPLGLQAMAVHMQKLAVQSFIGYALLFPWGMNMFKDLYLSETPAAKQLLVQRLNGSMSIDNTAFLTFQSELKNLGYPQLCRNIAISNGSECGTPNPLSPSGNIIFLAGYLKPTFWGDLLGSLLLPTVGGLTGQPEIGLLGFIPGSNKFTFHFEVNALAQGGGNMVYHGRVTYKKKILWFIPINVDITNKTYNAPGNLISFDNLPGGAYYKLPQQEKSSDPDADNTVYKLSIKKGFSFIPTTSALDIGKGQVVLSQADYYQPYVGATPPPAPKNTPFNNFITAFSGGIGANEEHISFTQRNGKWLADELNLQSTFSNCSYFCSLSSNAILGPSCFDINQSYNISLPVGSTIKWSVFGPAIISGANDQSTVSLSGNGIGTATLYATIQNEECGTKTVSKSINVGIVTPQIAYTFVMGNVPIWYTFKVTNPSPNLVYKWYVNDVLNFTSQPGENLFLYQGTCNTYYNVKCTASSDCLTSGYSNVLIPGKTCLSAYHFAPNPVDDELKVYYTEEMIQEFNRLNTSLPGFEIRLYNEKGLQVYSQQSREGEPVITIDTRKLPNGNYFLHIQQGRQVVKEQIIIQH